IAGVCEACAPVASPDCFVECVCACHDGDPHQGGGGTMILSYSPHTGSWPPSCPSIGAANAAGHSARRDGHPDPQRRPLAPKVRRGGGEAPTGVQATPTSLRGVVSPQAHRPLPRLERPQVVARHVAPPVTLHDLSVEVDVDQGAVVVGDSVLVGHPLVILSPLSGARVLVGGEARSVRGGGVAFEHGEFVALAHGFMVHGPLLTRNPFAHFFGGGSSVVHHSSSQSSIMSSGPWLSRQSSQ